MKKGFILYNDYKQHFDLLSNEELGILIRGTFAYEAENTEPNFDGKLQMAFSFIKAQLDRDSQKYQKKVAQCKAAGQASGRKRALTKPTNKETATTTDTTTAKEKEEKITFADCVHLTQTQHQTLLQTHGEAKTNALIQTLNNYKASHGKTYKSDYHAIQNWVIKKHEEQTSTAATSIAKQPPTKSHNYQQRTWDYDKLATLERQRLISQTT